ncbi:MAG: glycosyltransferase, partial [candidate division NC10 bacterium]|nr:glycosyltransferase [candidate division NC10 bacterium]
MRVLVDGVPLLGDAGIATYLRGLLLHLAAADRRHEYRLFFRGFRAETRRRVARFLADPEFAGFPATLTRVPDRVLQWCWDRRSLLRAAEGWLGRPDLFLSTVHMTPALPTIPVVVIAYDLIPLHFPEFYGPPDALRARMRRSLERATAIIAISECTRRDLVTLLGADPERIHVVYPAADARFPAFAFLFLVICGGDAFAELIGRAWPAGRGFVAASPGKTVSGLIGGLAAAVVLGVIV